MSARADARRIVALVQCLDRIAAGERISLGELAGSVFGWPADRVFSAVALAVERAEIAKTRNGEVSAETTPAPPPDMPPPAIDGVRLVPVRTCQGCGCTDAHACPGGCSWAQGNPDLCSRCVPEVAGVYGAYRIERVRLPSAIRYGRLAVDPVWIVVGPGESGKRFMRKRDARAFVDTLIEEAKAAAEERAP